MTGWEGRAAVPSELGQSAEPGDRRSLNPEAHGRRVRFGTTFNSRARGRGGKMRLRISLLLFFTAVLLLPYPTCAQSSSQSSSSTRGATIRGTVYDPDGRAVPDAEVTLLGSLIAAGEMRTDSRGEYKFDGLAGGTYSVAANLPGFTSVSAEIKAEGSDDSV